MNNLFRALAAFLAAVTAFYMTLWLIGAMLLPQGTPFIIRCLASLAAAVWIGRYMWRRPESDREDLARAMGVGALLVGGAGFVAGFFGPMILAPGANQGPLLGIFITGPLGAVAGAIGGAILWKRRPAP
jgi:hypothetical protein